MYLLATYETAHERQADFLREAARQRVIREAEKARRSTEPPTQDAHASRLPETTLLDAMKRGLAAVGARLMAL